MANNNEQADDFHLMHLQCMERDETTGHQYWFAKGARTSDSFIICSVTANGHFNLKSCTQGLRYSFRDNCKPHELPDKFLLFPKTKTDKLIGNYYSECFEAEDEDDEKHYLHETKDEIYWVHVGPGFVDIDTCNVVDMVCDFKLIPTMNWKEDRLFTDEEKKVIESCLAERERRKKFTKDVRPKERHNFTPQCQYFACRKCAAPSQEATENVVTYNGMILIPNISGTM